MVQQPRDRCLRERGAALVSLDLPPLEGFPSVLDVVTSSLAYIRLHGRNAPGFWGSDSASRYHYLYSEGELAGWADRVRALSARTDRLVLYFNNHRRGQAVENATAFASILSRAGNLP